MKPSLHPLFSLPVSLSPPLPSKLVEGFGCSHSIWIHFSLLRRPPRPFTHPLHQTDKPWFPALPPTSQDPEWCPVPPSPSVVYLGHVKFFGFLGPKHILNSSASHHRHQPGLSPQPTSHQDNCSGHISGLCACLWVPSVMHPQQPERLCSAEGHGWPLPCAFPSHD